MLRAHIRGAAHVELSINIHFRPITYLCELTDTASEYEREEYAVHVAMRKDVSESLLERTNPVTRVRTQVKFKRRIDTVHIVRQFYEVDCINF